MIVADADGFPMSRPSERGQMARTRLTLLVATIAFAGCCATACAAPAWLWCEVTGLAYSDNTGPGYFTDIFMGDSTRRIMYEIEFTNYMKSLHPRDTFASSNALCDMYSTQSEGQQRRDFDITHYGGHWVHVDWYPGLRSL
jgi:hypothetical protein